MRATLLEHLACPDCGGDIAAEDTRPRGALEAGDPVEEGTLRCTACRRAWPIVGGVPDFVGGATAGEVAQTTAGFARNWVRYEEVILREEALNARLLRDWVAPLRLDALAGKVALDAGCGMGRWLRAVARQGPRAAIGVDMSEVVWAAARAVRDQPNAHVVRGDLFRLPIRPTVDVVLSIGVLHHTPDPAAAFAAVQGRAGPGGVTLAWVYGAEGSGWLERWVTPLRRHVTSRLPDRALLGLSRALTVPLWAGARATPWLPAALPVPSRPYLEHLRLYPRRYLEHIVYDHLVPSLAAYLPRAEVEAWARGPGLAYHLSQRNGNSWRLIAAPDRGALARALEPAAWPGIVPAREA